MMKCNKVHAIGKEKPESLALPLRKSSIIFLQLTFLGREEQFLLVDGRPPQLTSKQGKGYTNPSGGSGGAVDFVFLSRMGVWVLECPGRVSGAHLEVPFILFSFIK